MKILHTVEFYRPSVGGAQEVVRQVSERLAARGHHVTVATSALPDRKERVIDGVHVVEFDIGGNEVRGYHGRTSSYERFLLEGDFDVVMNYAAQQWTADLAFPLLNDMAAARVFAPCGFALAWPQYADYYRRMPDVLRRYDALIFHSEGYQDVRFAQRHGLSHGHFVPNGCSEVEFSAHRDPSFHLRYGIPEDVPLLLHVGTHTGAKGHSAAIAAFRKAKIGRAVLLMIGNCMGSGGGCLPRCRLGAAITRSLSWGCKRVVLANPPRSDVVAAYHAADVFVFPSLIECSPLVLFEAMASRTPFLATPCGNSVEIAAGGGSGVIIRATRQPNGFLLADENDLAEQIERLVKDKAVREAMAARGHAKWRESFTWEKIVCQYERVYQEAIDHKRVALRAAA